MIQQHGLNFRWRPLASTRSRSAAALRYFDMAKLIWGTNRSPRGLRRAAGMPLTSGVRARRPERSIRLTETLALSLQPKTSICNLFGMFEYAYRLNSFDFGHGRSARSRCRRCEQLASVLARRILDRSRKGLYRAYLPEDQRLAYIRGRFDVPASVRRPSGRQSALSLSRTHGGCGGEPDASGVDAAAHRAQRLLPRTRAARGAPGVSRRAEFHLATAFLARRLMIGGCTTPPPRPAPTRTIARCMRWPSSWRAAVALYRRPADGAVRGQHGPVVRAVRGGVSCVPKPDGWRVKKQTSLSYGSHGQRSFRPDIIIEARSRGLLMLSAGHEVQGQRRRMTPTSRRWSPSSDDRGCRETALIYPSLPENAETYSLQGIRVHSVSFAVDGDLEEAGRLLAAIGEMA